VKIKDIIPRLKQLLGIRTGRLLDGEGNQTWYFHWKEHRDGGPAYVGANGTQKWYQYGALHREGGAPAIEWAYGDREWYRNGVLHREGAPAIEKVDGTREWWQEGKRHREDGPAIEKPEGKNEWFLNGNEWREGNKLTPAIQEEKKTKVLEEVAQGATVADESVKIMQPVKFRKPGEAPGL
jgi:hypothetical protein